MYLRSKVDMIAYPPIQNKDKVSTSLWTFKKAEYDLGYNYDGEYTFAKYSYTFERKSLYYEVTILAPIFMLFVIAMIAFWLPPDSGKDGMCMTLLLAFSVYQLLISDRTPITSDITPNISK